MSHRAASLFRVATLLCAGAIFAACDLLAGCSLGANPAPYAEPYRPAYHFTPARNWMNDPNGLVYFDGEYHLFFQHNPKGPDWGNMSWGHAVSADLVNWSELPLAIAARDDVMIYSGSAVVDWRNTSGFSADAKPTLVAAYTGHHGASGIERQYIAYSADRGRTWTQFPGNPVIDSTSLDFRDPKVFWHEKTARWVMVVAYTVERQLAIYTSRDLKAWEVASRFVPAAPRDGVFECPDLFELDVEGGGTKWVMAFHFKARASAPYVGGTYVVGDFDGKTFTPENEARADEPDLIDHGADFYAAQSWSDIPATDGRRIWIGWMANVVDAGETPTKLWRGAMTIPRALSLVRRATGYRLRQSPVRELEGLRAETARASGVAISGRAVLPLPQAQTGAVEIKATLRPGTAAETGLRLVYGWGQEVRVAYDADAGQLIVDRTKARAPFSERFADRRSAPVALKDGLLELHIFLDRSSIEVFAQDGERVFTDLLFPQGALSGIEAYARGDGGVVEVYDAWRMQDMRRQAR